MTEREMSRSPLGVAWIVAVSAFSLTLLAGGPSVSRAASGALIVAGLSGTSSNAEEFQRLSGETRRLLAERGLPADRIEILPGKPTREVILQKLQAAAGASNSPEDEFWLVLYGHCGRSQGGAPAFQVSGPRLTAADLKTALDAIPARQFVFIGAGDSGAFLPVLQNPRRAALSATKNEGESSQPRYPAAWVSAFAENPKASFASIAARASALVEKEYVDSSLALTEHARLADPTTGKILEPPFGVDLLAAKEPARTAPTGGPSTPGGPSVADIKVKVQKPDAQWEQQPATDETRKIAAAARATPNPEGHSALVLEQRLGFTVEEDRTTDRATFYRVYLAREEAVEDWANPFLPQSPPAVTTKLELARVIQPDGACTVFNPAKLPGAADPETGESSGTAMVFLPNAHAGCVIELGYRTRELLNSSLPHVSETLPLQRRVPALQTALEVRVPEKGTYRVALFNLPGAKAEESAANGRRVFRWKFDAIPAAESLPGDPPAAQWQAWVGISSLPSWEEFAAWYRRLAQGSDAIDDAVKKIAAELAEGSKGRMDTLRRDFEFVSALRYVAVEIGVQGFRPRTPAQVLSNRYGDCKDKANLLVALLRCQNIPARFVLLNRGGMTDVNFPSWQFNHAIAFAPRAPEAGQPDDLWMDSTDSVTPFGFVPPGDYGRAGLVFDKDRAEFKTVVNGAGQISEVRDEWELAQDAPGGGWRGTFHRAATGMADDGLRRMFRGASPAQRNALLFRLLADLWPNGDFARGTVSDVSELRNGVELRAEATAPAGGDWPRIHAPGMEIFSAPERNRVLWLNDGQPLALTQTLRLRYADKAPAELPASRQTQAAGAKLSLVWERIDDRTLRRTAKLELLQPVVPAADYAALRQAIRGWSMALAR
jgi:hypothetical protein